MTANYKMTRRLRSVLGCQTTGYLALTTVKKIKFSFFGQFAENCRGSQRVKINTKFNTKQSQQTM